MRILFAALIVLVSACVDHKKSGLNSWAGELERNGNLRLDRDPEDIDLDAEMLARNFEKIAFNFENDPLGTGVVQTDESGASMLRRWEDDIRLSVLTVPGRNTGTVRRDVFAFMRKLKGLTGIKFELHKRSKREEAESANLLVLVGDDAYFDAVIPFLRTSAKGWSDKKREAGEAFVTFLGEWHRSYSPCAGNVYVELSNPEDETTETGRIVGATVAIRSDLIKPFTQVCIEEELAQVMGLVNDDPEVRPSIFNDDQEFALLTRHDELLLRILYDDRLNSGMTPEQAMPIVRQIAAELLPDA